MVAFVATAKWKMSMTYYTALMLAEVGTERRRQDFLIQKGVIPWNCANVAISHQQKLVVLTEEHGEVARAILEQTDIALKTN